jgi:hypothetical protein
MQAKTVSKKREKNEEIYSMVEEFSRGPKASPRARSFNKGFKQNTVMLMQIFSTGSSVTISELSKNAWSPSGSGLDPDSSKPGSGIRIQ